MPAAHDTVPSPPPTASTSARSAARAAPLEIVALPELDDLGLRQRVAHLVDDACAGAATRSWIDHQHHAGAVRAGRGVDPQRVGGRQLRRHGRRHYPRAQHRDRRPDAESREHIARDSARRWRRATCPTSPASSASPSPSGGFSSPTPTANAAALAEWPDGSEFDVGGAPAPPAERHREAVRPRALPDPLGDLVGEQAGHGQGHHAASRAAPSTLCAASPPAPPRSPATASNGPRPGSVAASWRRAGDWATPRWPRTPRGPGCPGPRRSAGCRAGAVAWASNSMTPT